MKDNNYIYIFLHPPRTGGESLTTFLEENLFQRKTLRWDRNKTLKNIDKIRFVSGHTTYFGIHKKFPDKKPRYITSMRDPADALVSLYHSRMDDFPENQIQSFEEWYSLRKRNEYTLFFDNVFRSQKKEAEFSHRLKFGIIRILNRLDKSKRIHTLLKKLFIRQNNHPEDETKKLENAKRLLSECWFVSITEKQRDDLKFLFESIGAKADIKKYKVLSKESRILFELDDKMRKKIYEENPLDLELYKYALKLNKRKKDSL